MVTEIRIYAEGGGDHSDSRAAIRDGFSAFLAPLRELAPDRRIGLRVIPCGSRRRAFENFIHALTDHAEAFNVLLVDSESQVTKEAWLHLQEADGWQGSGFSGDQCHLMVCAVEAWLIADPEALAGFYGQRFLRNALPRRENVEDINKQDLFSSLERATRGTQKGEYHKIRHCSRLLGLLNRERVRSRARHCDRLFTTLEAKIRGT